MTVPLNVSDSPLFARWVNMRQRCSNPKHPQYRDYGGRGITVCADWQADFRAYETWCLAHGWEPGLQVDRENNDGHYTPDNCRVVTRLVNNRNKRTVRMYTAFGETKTLPDWADDERCQVSYDLLRQRVRRDGVDLERALYASLA